MNHYFYKARSFILFTVLLGFVIHGYRFMNLNLTHDSLGAININEAPQGLISIGRFLYYFYYKVFPVCPEPFFCGFISLVFLGIGNFFICSLFNFNRLQSISVCALMTVAIPFTLFSATYIGALPLFSLTFALSSLSVFVMGLNNKKGFVLACTSLAIAMGGEDQSIIQFACMLCFIRILIDLFEEKCFKEKIFLILRYVLFIVVSGIIYFILYKLSVIFSGVQPSDGYNSLSNMSIKNYLANLSDRHFWQDYYKYPNKFFYHSSSSDYQLPYRILVNIAIIITYSIIIIYPFVYVIKNNVKKGLLFLYYFFLALSPFVINCVYFVSNGLMHDLMKLSYYFPFFLCIHFFGKISDNLKNKSTRFNKLDSYSFLMYLPIYIVILSSSVFAKNAYLLKEQQFIFIQQTINRIVYGIENTKLYIPGKTGVVFIGNLDGNPNINKNIQKMRHTGLNGAISYNGPFITYLNEFLGCNMNIIAYLNNKKEIYSNKFYAQNIELTDKDYETLEKAPLFPQRGYITDINGTLFVKISE